MAEPSLTRRQLRRMLGRRLNLEFYNRYPNGLAADTDVSSTATMVYCDDLTQTDDWWNESYFYDIYLDETVPVRDFYSGSYLTLEFPRSAAAVTEGFELTDIWTPQQIHDAIDMAILEASQAFPDVNTTTMVLEEGKLTYDLSSLSIRQIVDIRIRQPRNSFTGTVTEYDGGTNIVTLSTGTSGMSAGDVVTLYSGNGSGYDGIISAIVSATSIELDTAPVPNPTANDKFRVWDPNQDELDDTRIITARFDHNNFPGTLYLRHKGAGFDGMFMTINYVVSETGLSTDTSSTVVPAGYIIPKALGILYETAMSSTRVDVSRYSTLSNHYHQQALDYRQKNRWQNPTTSRFITPTEGGYTGYDVNVGDPLDWLR